MSPKRRRGRKRGPGDAPGHRRVDASGPGPGDAPTPGPGDAGDPPPLSPTAAGLGCGAMGGASLAPLLWLAGPWLAPPLGEALGVEIGASAWAWAAIGAGGMAAVGLAWLATRAFRQVGPR